MNTMEDLPRSQMVALLRQRGIRDTMVLNAMQHVPRHHFVPEDLRWEAYGDYPLPIGHGQTISQPYIVALMTEALTLQPGDKVLELGTGSGYQAAILAEMGMEVYTIEIVPALHEAARALLAELGYVNVHCRLGDGNAGWEEYAPYAGIIATAAPAAIPSACTEQLAEGGRLVIPVGPRGGYQNLWKVTRRGNTLQREDLGGVAFVPLV